MKIPERAKVYGALKEKEVLIAYLHCFSVSFGVHP